MVFVLRGREGEMPRAGGRRADCPKGLAMISASDELYLQAAAA
eukprot:CAMPEP_0179328378 /NCGR_PEP_ID=MMETSP0797-20121207/62486_1 /TAXON_ID=47934 /ORGANISM="Dinophysis acuminata, Strain DAEP01" /LENGTH=42 /DNA_ID= /DNA_START= /DNA_END= /DNA_ORIENTATION=